MSKEMMEYPSPVTHLVGWQDISTAPKDGTRILVAGSPYGPAVKIAEWGSGPYLGRVKGYKQCWTDQPGHEIFPTHWMHLPAPPALASEGQAE